MRKTAWYQDGAARSFIFLRYLPWLAGLNLAWELAHTRLYTLWSDASPSYIAFSILHCTAGDAMVGVFALVLALVLVRASALALWRWPRIVLLTMIIGVGYTAFSEWMNIVALQSWTYADSMPVLRAFGLEIGISPLVQWLLLPPLALRLARRRVLGVLSALAMVRTWRRSSAQAPVCLPLTRPTSVCRPRDDQWPPFTQ